MNRSRATVLALRALCLLALAGCTREATPPADPTPAEVPQTTASGTTTAEAVIGDLRAHGFKVGRVGESEAFGAKESVDVRIDGVEAGVLTFVNVDMAYSWADTSESFGGIAVVGDTWAVSLDSDGSGGTSKAQSRALAAKIAEAIGGTVR
jgi:hypothetical protein